jgi:acyl carrier protein
VTGADAASGDDHVLDQVVSVLGEIVGEDVIEALEVGAATSLSADLELESIEFVVLGEKLLDRFGESVDFLAWSAKMELEELMELTVGDIADFVTSCAG